MLIAFAAFIGSRAIAALFAGRWHGNPRERRATLRAKTGLPPPYSAWQSSLSVTNWGDATKLSGPGHGIRQSASIAAMIHGLAGISYYPTAFRAPMIALLPLCPGDRMSTSLYSSNKCEPRTQHYARKQTQ